MIIREQISDSVTMDAPAKVNLYLQVLRRREDGYHDINSLFQAVSLFDRVKFQRTSGPTGIELSLAAASDLPTDESNLIVRAYQLMQTRFKLEGRLQVELDKQIPIAAGLGGGSSDAAATILACTLLWDLPLDYDQMADLGLKIGSDLPFFFSRGQALVSGRGEIIQPTGFPTDYWLILVTPNLTISTADSYATLSLRLTKSTPPVSLERSRTALELVESLGSTGNDFEEVYLGSYPELGKIRDGLLNSGALLARMSGSGPTFFGFFDSAPESMTDILIGQDDWRVSTVRPVVLPATRP